MKDRILTAFLERQRRDGMALAAASDLLDLVPVGTEPPQHYLAHFRCTGLVKSETGEIVEANRFAVGIWFPDEYLREADPATVVTWLEPRGVFHPQVLTPFICLGRLMPATSLVDLLYRCFEIITYARLTMREEDALNRDACAWARRNVQRFPLDRRPLKRRPADADAPDFDVEPLAVTP